MTSLIDNNQADHAEIDDETLNQYIGPGGKFYREDKDAMLKELGKAKAESDRYIKFILDQKDELADDFRKFREEANTGTSLKEVLDQIATLKQSPPPDDTHNRDNDNRTAFDPNQLESLIENKLTAREAQRKADENFRKVQDKLIETFGKNYQQPLKQHIEEAGLDIQDIDALARKSPAAAIKLLGIEATTESFDSPIRNQQRTGFSPRSAEKRTWTWYQKMKSTDPVKYHDPKTQTQMYKDAAELGKDFRDGDFYS